jgi:hypothetical protein
MDKYALLHKIRETLNETRTDIAIMKRSLAHLENRVEELEALFARLEPTRFSEDQDRFLWFNTVRHFPFTPPPSPPSTSPPTSPEWPDQRNDHIPNLSQPKHVPNRDKNTKTNTSH